jgi:hypothetical protein
MIRWCFLLIFYNSDGCFRILYCLPFFAPSLACVPRSFSLCGFIRNFYFVSHKRILLWNRWLMPNASMGRFKNFSSLQSSQGYLRFRSHQKHMRNSLTYLICVQSYKKHLNHKFFLLNIMKFPVLAKNSQIKTIFLTEKNFNMWIE